MMGTKRLNITFEININGGPRLVRSLCFDNDNQEDLLITRNILHKKIGEKTAINITNTLCRTSKLQI